MLVAVEKYTFYIFKSYRWTKSFIANTHISVATILGWFVRFQAIVVTQTVLVAASIQRYGMRYRQVSWLISAI